MHVAIYRILFIYLFWYSVNLHNIDTVSHITLSGILKYVCDGFTAFISHCIRCFFRGVGIIIHHIFLYDWWW